MRPFAVIRGALDAAQLDALRREADALAAETPPSVENGCVCEPLCDDPQGAWRVDRAAYVAARKRPPAERVLFEVLPRIAEQHLGSSQVVLFNEHYVVKPPCTSVEFRWHADAELQIPGWSPETCPRYVSCWCALDDCDEANGCLVVKHAGEAVPVRCGAGDVVLLADDCVHSSGANASSSARRAYYAQYSSAPIVAGAGPLRLAIPCPPASVELPAQRAVLFPELVGAPAPVAAASKFDDGSPEFRDFVEGLAAAASKPEPAPAAPALPTAPVALAPPAAPTAAPPEPARKRPRLNLRGPDVDECLRELRAITNQAAVDAPDASLLEAAAANQGNEEAWRLVCDKAYQVLHDPSRHWRDAPIEWRRAYAVAAYYRASLLDDVGEAVRQADLGLMLGDTRHRSHLLELIEALDPEPDQYAGPAWRTPMPNPSARSVSSSKDILRLSAPSMSTFREQCFDVATPAILEGVIEHWPALQKWSDLGYLNHVAGRRLVPVELGRHYLDEKWSEQLMPLSSFLREYVQKGDAHAYLAQHALLDQIPRLRRDIASHDYCGLGEGDVTQNAWIGFGTVSPLHRDASHNLLAQVVGAKYVRLYAPSESSSLYPVLEGVPKGVSSHIELDAFAPTNPDQRREALRKFPLFETAEYIDLILLKGEVLYIPPGWWHYVEALEYSCSVSSWWGRRE